MRVVQGLGWQVRPYVSHEHFECGHSTLGDVTIIFFLVMVLIYNIPCMGMVAGTCFAWSSGAFHGVH